MSLTIDPTIPDLDEWTAELSLVDHWLHSMWGVGPGVSSPAPAVRRVHPSGLAAAGWLSAMWGFTT